MTEALLPTALPSHPFVQRVAGHLLERLSDLTDELMQRLVREDAFYAEAMPHMADEIRCTIRQNVGQLIRGMIGLEPFDYDLPRVLARRRAEQGVPVAALLHAYRLAAEVIWENASEISKEFCEQDFDRAEVLDAANGLWSLTDRYSEIIRLAFEDTVSEMVRSSKHARATLLDLLFEGGRDKIPLTADAARVLDLPQRGPFLVVAAEVRDDGVDGLPRVQQALQCNAVRSVWRRRSERQLGLVVIGSPTDGNRQEHVLEILRERCASRVGTSPVFTELGDTARYVALADIALNCLAPREHGITRFEDCTLASFVAAAPEVGHRVGAAVLGSVLELEPLVRDALLETLTVWVDAGGSTTLTSQRLYCHRNTVRNRLQRVETLTGRSLAEPRAVAEICIALEAVRLLAHRWAR